MRPVSYTHLDVYKRQALMVSKYLILIQQGDGRCDVFYKDGSVDQPIPWDERCKGSTTTSMCDTDAFASIRSAVIDTEERGVVACYIRCV